MFFLLWVVAPTQDGPGGFYSIGEVVVARGIEAIGLQAFVVFTWYLLRDHFNTA